MSGISFVSDEKGNTTAVMIDLKKYRRVWEDFYDRLIIEQRKKERRINWETAKRTLKQTKAK